jgi:hypothetical protein
VRPQEANEGQPSSNEVTPPTQEDDPDKEGEQDEDDDQDHEMDNNQGGDEQDEDGDDQEKSRSSPLPHPRVRQTVQCGHPVKNILGAIFSTTLSPRIGDSSTCPQCERNLIQYYVQRKWFSVFDYMLFDYMLQEIINILRTGLRSCGYAPQIMMMIEKVSGIEFLKDHEISDLKPQFPAAPIISKDVPSASAATRSTCSGTTAPPSAPPSSSSSLGGVLRVLKSMFAWCCDTRRCQDMLLSNQRCQNEKLGIDEFDELSLPVPPLDDDPFASLSAADIAGMEAAIDDIEGGFGSEYDKEEEGDDDDKDYDD